MVSFDHIRYRRHDASAFLYAFDLIELNGDDLRRDPLEARKTRLANVVARRVTAFGSMTTSRKTARPYFVTSARWVSKASCRSGRTLPIAAADHRMAQDEEPCLRCREARGRGRLGPMTEGKNRIMISEPRREFRTAEGEMLAI
jgi:hypothetical protein